MKAKKEDKCLRTVSRHFLGGSFFVGTLVKKKFDCQNFMDRWREQERESKSRRVFEILSVVALLLSFSLHYNILRRSRRRSRRRRRANLYPLVSSRNYRTERSFFLKSISEERERDRERRQRVY